MLICFICITVFSFNWISRLTWPFLDKIFERICWLLAPMNSPIWGSLLVRATSTLTRRRRRSSRSKSSSCIQTGSKSNVLPIPTKSKSKSNCTKSAFLCLVLLLWSLVLLLWPLTYQTTNFRRSFLDKFELCCYDVKNCLSPLIERNCLSKKVIVCFVKK